jgi:hypothetical protein
MRFSRKGPPTSEDIKRNAERTYARYSPRAVMQSLGIVGKALCCYAYGYTPKGKVVCWGPMPPDEAEIAVKSLIDGEVFDLDTKDLTKAKKEIKAELMRRGMNPDDALRRMYSKEVK